MNKIEMAVAIWRAVNRLRSRKNWEELEETAQTLDKIAIALAAEAGTDFSKLVDEYDLYN